MENIEKVMGWLEGLTFDDWRDYHSDSEVSNTAKAALELLKEQANAYGYLQKQFFEVQDKLLAKPEIIRCKDCKYVECEGVEGFLVCDLSGFSHSPEFFCADGEMKDA